MPDLSPPTVSMPWLMERHQVLLLDAYGVLVHHTGALPHAAQLLDRLNQTGFPYFIVTNDSARLPATAAAKLADMGLTVPAERIISSGTLLPAYFQRHGIVGARCAVMGPPDSLELVRQAGGQVTTPGADAEVLIVADGPGSDFVDSVDDTLSMVIARLDRGQPVRLLLPNPDLIYPKTSRGFGITAGSVALIFEAALAQRYPDRPDLRFERLGKPNLPIFEAALDMAGAKAAQAVMVGDQPGTDIRGANAAGIPSALVPTGLASHSKGPAPPEERPTYLLASLKL